MICLKIAQNMQNCAPNHNYNAIFRQFLQKSFRASSRESALLAFALASATALAAIGGAPGAQPQDLPALLPQYAFAQADTASFVTTWKTTSANETVTLPVRGSDIIVNWGDGSENNINVRGSVSHTYNNSGTYNVTVSGGLQRIHVGNLSSTDAAKIVSLVQWGNSTWTTMNGAFEDATNMAYDATDAPDLSGVTDMNNMFSDARAFNGDISSWDVSGVTDMNSMLEAAIIFNGNISSWDVSSVTDMNQMFTSAFEFNQPLATWNVSSVTDMFGMFHDAHDFNRPLAAWNVSSVTDMRSMFSNAFAFEQNLGNWFIVPADTTYDVTEGTLNVTTVSAQNTYLDGLSITYGIGSGGNSTLFNMTGNALFFKNATSAGEYNVTVTASGVPFGTGNHHRVLDVRVTGAATNQLPTVTSITGASSINEDTSGTLVGMASDPDGTISSYLWMANDTSAVTINTGNAAILQYTALQVSSDTAVTFTLTVTDNDGDTGTGMHVVTVTDVAVPNQRPTVTSITGASTIAAGASGTLVGTATDGDGTVSSYLWTANDTSAVTITDGDEATLQYTALPVTSNTTVTFTLTVTDDDGDTAFDTYDVTVSDATPPKFVSSGLDFDTGALTVTFSEVVDATTASSIAPSKMHVRESGNYTHGVTLTSGELDTTVDSATISFTLTAQHQAEVHAMAAPQLSIDPGAVQDASGNAMEGTFDVSTASFTHSKAIGSQDTRPTGVAFSTDGTRMFVAGDDGNDINEYTLSTPFDVSSASSVDSFGVSGQDTGLEDVAFSGDGTRMFIAGNQHDDIHEYALSAAFDVSSASHVHSLDVGNKENRPYGVAFSNDGLRMFVVGPGGKDVTEYALTISFNTTTAAHVGETSVSSQDDTPSGVAFSNDGLKMFIAGNQHDDVFEYALTAPFNASTASHVHSFDVTPKTSDLTGVAFSSDGSRMYAVDWLHDNIHEYALSSAYPITLSGNAPPVLDAIGPQRVDEHATLTFTASATDINGDILLYSLAGSPPSGASINSTTGAFSWTPTASQVGTHVITVRVADAASAADSEDITVTVADNPATRFASSGLDLGTGALTITFSEVIDATPQTSVNSSKMHVRESGTYTGGVTLTAGELATASDSATISYALTAQHQAAVHAMTVPQLTIEPGAVQDASGNAIAGSFDVSTASFTHSKPIGSEDERATGVAFSTDGTRMFVAGDDGNDVNEYTLSTPFDVFTASYDSRFSVGTQDTVPEDVTFSNDGTRMFVAGNEHDDIHEYALSTAFDVSSANFTHSFDVGNEEDTPFDVAFSNDGLRMFVVGPGGKDVTEYALTISFNTTTAAHVGETSVSSQDDDPSGVAFSNDGLKMFIAGNQHDDVFEYALTAAFDASSASHVHSFDVTPKTPSLTGVAFSTDGSRMYAVDHRDDNIHEYALRSVYPITLSGNAPPVLDAIGPQRVDEHATLTFTASATDINGDTLLYSLAGSPPSGASINSTTGAFSWTPTASQIGMHTITVRVADAASATDSEDVTVTVSTLLPRFVSSGLDPNAGTLTITFSEVIDATPKTSVVSSKMHVRESGTRTGGVTLTAGELATASDSATISYALTAQHLAAVKAMTTPQLTIEPGAVQDGMGNAIADSFDVSTAKFTRSYWVFVQDPQPTGVAFSNDGSKMFVAGNRHDRVSEYALSTAFDISSASASFTRLLSVQTQDFSPQDVAFSNDGRKMFMLGTSGNDVNEYSLSRAFDVSSTSFTRLFSVQTQDDLPTGVAFSNDGYKMFVVGARHDRVSEYALSPAFDVSSASHAHSFYVGNEESSPSGVAFSNGGLKMFVVGTSGDDVNEYSLSRAFDVSSASFIDSFLVRTQDDQPADVAFSNDGSKMFVVGYAGSDVNEYALSSVYPITVTITHDVTSFVTTWQTTSANETVTIPVSGADITISWGDGGTPDVGGDWLD